MKRIWETDEESRVTEMRTQMNLITMKPMKGMRKSFYWNLLRCHGTCLHASGMSDQEWIKEQQRSYVGSFPLILSAYRISRLWTRWFVYFFHDLSWLYENKQAHFPQPPHSHNKVRLFIIIISLRQTMRASSILDSFTIFWQIRPLLYTEEESFPVSNGRCSEPIRFDHAIGMVNDRKTPHQ